MKNNITEIIFLLDRSGSMSGLESDTIGGFNGFVKSQCRYGQTRLTTVLFDDQYEVLHDGQDGRNVHLTEREYYTRGCTALLDAIGKTILDVGLRLSRTAYQEQPQKVIFVITTDGQENASREFSYARIQEMIEQQEKRHGWEFVFMAANIDVAQESQKLGIRQERAMAYQASPAGTAKMFQQADAMLCELRQEPEPLGQDDNLEDYLPDFLKSK